MSIIKRVLPKNHFARSVSLLFSGTVVSQSITIFAAFVLTRLYSPEMFGNFAVYTAVLSIIGIIASLRYETAIPLPKHDKEAARLVILSLTVLVVSTLLVLLLIVILFTFDENLLFKKKFPDLFWLVPAGVFFSGLYAIFYYWAMRKKKFSDIAITKIYQSSYTAIIQIVGFKLGTFALILGQIAGQSVGFFRLGQSFIEYAKKNMFASKILDLAYQYRKFPYFSTWDGLLNTASIQMFPIFLATTFGASYAGFFLLANRVIALPMTMFAGAFSQVFFSNAPDSLRNRQLDKDVSKLYEILLFVSISPILLLTLIAPELFSIFFGNQWVISGELVQWMSLWIFLQFLSSPISSIFVVLERQKELFYFQSILFLFRLISIIFGFLTNDFYISIMLFSLFSAVCYFFLLIWVFYLSKASSKKALKNTIRSVMHAALVVSPIFIYKLVFIDEFFILFLSFSAFFMIVYYSIGLKKVYSLST